LPLPFPLIAALGRYRLPVDEAGFGSRPASLLGKGNCG